MADHIEYAKSGRATCRGKCKQNMPKGLLRFASVSAGDRATPYYRCFPQCMSKKVADTCLEMYAGEALQVPGVCDLSAGDQTKVADAFARLVDGEEPDAWATDAPKEPEKKKQKRAPRKKKDEEEEEGEE